MRTLSLINWRYSLLLQLGLVEACAGAATDPGAAAESPAPAQQQPTDVLSPAPAQQQPTNVEPPAPPAQPYRLLEADSRPASACSNTLPEFSWPDDPGFDASDPLVRCTSNADCTAAPRGYCEQPVLSQLFAPTCVYACETDADCGAGSLCECGPAVGRCVPAECTSNAECESGQCLHFRDTSLCVDGYAGRSFYGYYACLEPLDECVLDSDCAKGQACTPTDPILGTAAPASQRRCQEVQLCGIGRPFLVEQQARLAPVVASADWSAASFADVAMPAASKRALLAERWALIGAMEHASVAAFARFTLQLLAVGAPAALVARSSAAMLDETRHAQLAFGLASHFAGTPLGPGCLPIAGALAEETLAKITANVFLEGCIGETTAAIEAAWASEQARDPVLRSLLNGIARDERAHAELAWAFVQWALSVQPAIAAELSARLARFAGDAEPALHSAPAGVEAEEWTAEFGLVPPAERARLRHEAFDEVVAPCLTALLERYQRPEVPAQGPLGVSPAPKQPPAQA